MAKKSKPAAENGGIPEWLQKILTASETVTLMRSQIHPADYNPREIGENERNTLKRGLKSFGLLGGILVNKQTGYTIVSGHQKVSLLDEMAGKLRDLVLFDESGTLLLAGGSISLDALQSLSESL